MNKCTKTTSGVHYWLHTSSIGNEKAGVWLDGDIFIEADKRCSACGLIDDEPTPKERTE